MRLFVVIGLIGLISSCKSKYELINPTSYNDSLRYDISIQSPTEVMEIINPLIEGKNTTLVWELTKKNEFEIILERTKLEDDSQEAERIIVTAINKNDTWEILKIKKSIRCWDGRGNTHWHSGMCE